MTSDAYRQVIDACLLDLSLTGSRFPSRNKLAEHIATLTGVSPRTVWRAIRHDQLDRLLDEPGPPESIYQVSDRSDRSDTETPITPERHVPTRAPAHPNPSPSGAASAPPTVSDPSADVVEAHPRPFVGGLDDPALRPLEVSDGRRRAKRTRTKFDGHCVACGGFVAAGWGWHTVPYPRHLPCPVHCESCWALVDHADAEAVAGQVESESEVRSSSRGGS